ncbi:hypothetical protein R3P38DRAFT_3189593 [Favolaschia claudopus]|uniref:Uncharacterized protein n=1 Tax=Favolaschia claudopus TaxID=2862362 RepID=A0AAW0BR76_9AGAR
MTLPPTSLDSYRAPITSPSQIPAYAPPKSRNYGLPPSIPSRSKASSSTIPSTTHPVLSIATPPTFDSSHLTPPLDNFVLAPERLAVLPSELHTRILAAAADPFLVHPTIVSSSVHLRNS